MAYILNKTDGSVLATLDDGVVNTTACALTLIGRNVTTYGERQNENFIHLLENFANSSSPTPALSGQTWYDTTNKQLKVNIDGNWQGVSTYTKSAVQPTNQNIGDLWYNSVTGQVSILGEGSNYALVGPMSVFGGGKTVVQSELILGISPPVEHEVLSFYVDDVRVAILSPTASFTTAITGFSTINPGFNLNTSVASVMFSGTASNSLLLNSLGSDKFLRSDSDTGTTGNISAVGNILVGATTQGALAVGPALSSNVGADGTNFTQVINSRANSGIVLRAKHNAELKDYVVVDAFAETVTVNATLIVTNGFNSNTASTLATARKITLDGDVTGNVMFDGSANVTINATLPVDRVQVAGDTMTGQLNALAGFVAGSGSSPNLIVATSDGVGILTTNPLFALDINGAVRSIPVVAPETDGTILLDGKFNNHQINLESSATITFQNFNQPGQIMRIMLIGTENVISWPSDVYWPNGAAPNFINGPKRIVVVTLMRPNSITPGVLRPDANFILATYVSY